MSVRLIGTDSDDPRLPQGVIDASVGASATDLAPGDVLADAMAYTDAAVESAVIDPTSFILASDAETIAGTVSDKGVTPAGLKAASPVIDVRSYGATGNGTTDDTTAIQAALTAVGTSGTVIIPNGTYKISGPLVPKSNTVIQGTNSTISQATQFKPVFDLFNVNGCTIRDFTLINASGSPASAGGSFRGDSEYAYSAGVWSNGERHMVANVRITNFAMGVYFNSSNGTTNVGDHVERVGNTIRGVEVSGCNHGVLLLNQRRTLVDGLYVHDHVDSSAGANALHGVYVTGATTDTSTDITVTNCLDVGCPNGTAYQFKYVNGLTVANLAARDCFGLFYAQDVYDVTGTNLSSVGDLATATGFYSFGISHVTAASARIDITRVTIQKAVDATGEMSLICNDATFTDFTLHTLKNGLNTNGYDVRIHGARITCDGFKLHNGGSSNAKGFLVGSTIATADITLTNFEFDNYRLFVDVHSGVTGLNNFDYAPFTQRRTPFGVGSYIMRVSGTPPYTVTRRECTNTYATVSNNAWPLAGLETTSRFNITTATAFTVQLPQIHANTGFIHEISIVNATAGALGTITWVAGYTWASGSAPTAPAAGKTLTRRFMFDGTNWGEVA